MQPSSDLHVTPSSPPHSLPLNSTFFFFLPSSSYSPLPLQVLNTPNTVVKVGIIGGSGLDDPDILQGKLIYFLDSFRTTSPQHSPPNTVPSRMVSPRFVLPRPCRKRGGYTIREAIRCASLRHHRWRSVCAACKARKEAHGDADQRELQGEFVRLEGGQLFIRT